MILLQGWLRRSYDAGTQDSGNSLLTIDEVGEVLGGNLNSLAPLQYEIKLHGFFWPMLTYGRQVPVNLKTEDRFHLTIEEYLHAVLSLVEELVI